MKIDADLWPAIRQHPWKYQSGRIDTVGAIIHATRSGIPGRSAALEYQSACNWFMSPNNVVYDKAGSPWFGGMSTYIVGGGQIAACVPPDLVPRFSAGIHDFRAISIEVGQGTNEDPYEEHDVELVLEILGYHHIQPNRVMRVDGNNNGWPGIVGHEDTAQGIGQGKSDPGHRFWETLTKVLSRQQNQEEPMGMSPAERALTQVAWGDYERMKESYRALVTKGIISEADGPLVFGDDTLNAAIVKRGRIMAAMAADAEAALVAIK